MYATMKNGSVSSADKYRIVDIRSDTVSKPTPEMMTAMMQAEVGDDVMEEDPTMNAFEREFARVMGKEAALFVPTGTMGNLIGIMVHCNNRGQEAICGDMSHTFLYEQAGAAYLGGVQQNPIRNNVDGTFSLDDVKRRIRGFDLHEPRTKLVLVENTHNMCGGKVLPLEFLQDLQKLAKENGLKVHMDGARVFNAAAHLKIPVADIVKYVDSANVCLSKGLSCPVGSMVVGTVAFIEEARRLRKALGGGMRQVGILAAAGLVSLQTIVPILYKDHENTYRVAKAIDELKSPTFKVDLSNVHSNILMVQLVGTKLTSSDFSKRLLEVTDEEIKQKCVDETGKGICVKASSRDWAFTRLVFYHQVSEGDVDQVIKKLTFVIRELEKK